MSTGRIPLTRLYERTSARGNRYLYGCLGYARVLGFQRETEDGSMVWELFVVDAPAPSPSARRDSGDGCQEEEGQAVAAVSPSPRSVTRRRPAARKPAVAPEAGAADDDGFDWDKGDALPF